VIEGPKALRVLARIEAMRSSDVPAVLAIDGGATFRNDELRVELERPWARLWVAREEGLEVVAFVVTWHVVDEVHVLNLATRKDRQRRGLAQALMEKVVAYGRRESVRHVLLEVRRSNVAAIALYEGLGFLAVGVRRRYYPDDEDAIEMALGLEAKPESP
jgi:ribosomal-protein-alanine N-acetyltransferase